MKTKNILQSLFTRPWALMATAIFVMFSASSYKPQGEKIKIGFIPLTDCAPLVVAKELGLFAKYGVDVELSKEASWANVRDKVLLGELQASHCLYSMPYSVYTGVGGKAGSEMQIAMMLNNNGQAITLSKDFCGEVGFKEYKKIPASVSNVQKRKKDITFAMTFPGGTHDLWLRYWLAATGVQQKNVNIITIPPPQMVANMRADNMEGYCVGEPWGGVAAAQGVGYTHMATQDMWKDHPEKALVVNKAFAGTRKADLKNVMKAILEACKWLDAPGNRKKAAAWLTKPYYVNAPLAVIEARMAGSYDLGCDLGAQKYKDDMMIFYKNGAVNMPRKSHGVYALAMYKRYNLIPKSADYKAITDKLVLDDLYAEVAKEMGIPIPDDEMKPFTLKLDNYTFDPANPEANLRQCAK